MSEPGFSRLVVPAVLALTLSLGLTPVAAYAQSRLVAPREGNIWGWTPHQPARGATRAKEKAAGVALPPRQNQQATGDVERLDRELLSAGQ